MLPQRSGLNIGLIIFHTSIRTAVTCLTRGSIWRFRANTIIFFVSNVDEFLVYGCALQVFRISNESGATLTNGKASLPWVQMITCLAKWNCESNKWVASNRILVFAHRSLGSPQGKHCNSLEENVWRKVVPTSKKHFRERYHRFFAALLLEMDLGNAETRKA